MIKIMIYQYVDNDNPDQVQLCMTLLTMRCFSYVGWTDVPNTKNIAYFISFSTLCPKNKIIYYPTILTLRWAHKNTRHKFDSLDN